MRARTSAFARAPLALAVMMLPLACAGGGADGHRDDDMIECDYQGPPVTAELLANGDLRVEMTAPTAGHTLALVDVARVDGRAVVHLRHDAPTDLVAQVITTLPLVLPADSLADAFGGAFGDAREVHVRVAHGDDAPQLAAVVAR